MQQIEVYSPLDFKKWLVVHHQKEIKVALIIYKRHTGLPFPSHRSLLEIAICYGWVDTIVKRLDQDRYIRYFTQRNKNSRWSENTLSYAKELIRENQMTAFGLKWYQEGKKKKTHDHGIPKNPEMPEVLKRALEKNATAKSGFAKLPPSTTKMLIRWYLGSKQGKTQQKRIISIIEQAVARNQKI
ncbi:MAG: hypothetical protein HOH47_04390 [Flavobacteriaceae bacterium]|nr:hypothetical protein [Flavobacteriaceae bacterium]